ncbi:MAG: metallophosphoesterase [Synechococcales bacterium]|nr:metallophosphoesterase [Synechococcales bacterium]
MRYFFKFLSHLFQNSLKFLAIAFLVLALAIGYSRKIEPNWIQVTQVPVVMPHLAPSFDGYRIVQLTDIHADDWMTRDRLTKITQLVNEQHPDLVVLTGDYITKAAPKYAPSLAGLAGLIAPDGALAVLGNHDQWTDPAGLAATLESHGIQVLKNRVQTIVRGADQLHIAGVGDVWSEEDDLPKVLEQLPKEGAAVMLAHEPDFADEVAVTERFDLELSGHSHGGQVKLPFFKRVTPMLGRKYPVGRYQVGSLVQYTSRGVGMAKPHLRFNCRPEVTVVTLQSPNPAVKS